MSDEFTPEHEEASGGVVDIPHPISDEMEASWNETEHALEEIEPDTIEQVHEFELELAYGAAKPAASFWQRLKKFIFGSSEDIESRLRSLSLAVEKFPDTPSNYVLRGELYLDVGEYELAAADFQRALELATAQFETSDWGILAQVMRDRAAVGLEKARRLE